MTTERQNSLTYSSDGGPNQAERRRQYKWVWFSIFVIAIALLGGSSRADPIQHAMLRPIAALLLIPAIIDIRPSDFAKARSLCLLFCALVFWMIAQIVPLPPNVWHELQGRETIVALDSLTGLEAAWRPISMAPFRSMDTLLGMAIPLAALVLVLGLKIAPRALFFTIMGLGLIDAGLGLLQVVGGPNTPFYFYALGGDGAPAGIFANENHSAVFSAIVLLVLTRLALDPRKGEPRWIRFAIAPSFIFILLTVLVSASRAGYAATMLALVGAGLMFILEKAPSQKGARDPLRGASQSRLAFGGLSFGIFLVVAAFLWADRTPAVRDFFAQDSFEDLRWSLLPVLRQMMADHWVLGTGFGSFEAVYRIYEPTELLLPSYVNHAHNDWAQLVIEGGLPAILILGMLLTAVVKTLLSIGIGSQARVGQCVFWAACLAIISAASIVDYPLRTPTFQAVVIWLILCLFSDRDTILRERKTV